MQPSINFARVIQTNVATNASENSHCKRNVSYVGKNYLPKVFSLTRATIICRTVCTILLGNFRWNHLRISRESYVCMDICTWNSLSSEIDNIPTALSSPAPYISPLTFCSLCSFSRKDSAILFAWQTRYKPLYTLLVVDTVNYLQDVRV